MTFISKESSIYTNRRFNSLDGIEITMAYILLCCASYTSFGKFSVAPTCMWLLVILRRSWIA